MPRNYQKKSQRMFTFLLCLYLSAISMDLASAAPAVGTEVSDTDRWRIGYASTVTFSNSDSISIERTFGQHYAQIFGGIPSWEKFLSWSVGGSFKWTAIGTISKGLHVGPLAGFGRTNDASLLFAGVALGGHYAIADFMTISVDGGPTITSVRGGEIVNFQVKPFGTLLGASVHFFLN